MTTTTIGPAIRQAPVLDLARRLHDTVGQRLAGLSYLLAANPGADELTDRCRTEVEAALLEMRNALASVGPISESAAVVQADVAGEARALSEVFPSLEFRWDRDRIRQIEPAGLVESFLVEALRNVGKHARPSRLSVEVTGAGEATVVEVSNDGVILRDGVTCGVGRRLLEVEASFHGALVESAAAGPGRWSQRLILSGAADRSEAPR